MIIVVTGSREIQHYGTVAQKLTESLQLDASTIRPLTVLFGDCPTGADKFAKLWCDANLLIKGSDRLCFKEFEADWDRRCDADCYHPPRFRKNRLYCPVAGHLRNQEMVDYAVQLSSVSPQPIICYAFFAYGAANVGTTDCARRAKETKIIKVTRVWEPRD